MIKTNLIKQQIDSIDFGITFKYKDLSVKADDLQRVAKVFERLVKKGMIKRVSKGIFYKPKKTVFGELRPNEDEILKQYLFDDSKRIAYITGTSLYNRMRLTTQVPNVIQIASRSKRIYISKWALKAKPVKSYVDVTNSNYKFLEFLDTLKDFRTIQDLDKKSALIILSNILKKLDTDKLVKYALKYPPRVRAFLGALLEQSKNIKLKALKNSLNPLSSYYYGINQYLKTGKNWNLK